MSTTDTPDTDAQREDTEGKRKKKKTSSKPGKMAGKSDTNIIADETILSPLTALKPYHKNPRVGNVDLIAESLKKHGQYRPLVVQRSTREILAGNHTYQAALKLGWDRIAINFIDVDNEEAARIVLVDNRSNDLASYNNDVLAELLGALPDVVGTGYTPEDMELLMDTHLDADVVDSIMDDTQSIDPEKAFDSITFGEEPDGTEDDDEEDDAPMTAAKVDKTLENASESFGGVFQLDDDVYFPGATALGIPVLREDRLIEELPEPLDSWAGSATKDWPIDDQWWLYNFGADSTSGMKDVSRIVLSFYAWDEYFENWWYYPSRYVAKALNSGVKYAITPNFSMPSEAPRLIQAWNLYRSRWLGRFMQEAGLLVAPDVAWPDGDIEFLEKYTVKGLPVGIPLISFQLQTLDLNATVGGEEMLSKCIRRMVELLEPKKMLLYAGNPGKEFVEGLGLDTEIQHIGTRVEKLSIKAKSRKKREGL